jgi:hypothetical protein
VIEASGEECNAHGLDQDRDEEGRNQVSDAEAGLKEVDKQEGSGVGRGLKKRHIVSLAEKTATSAVVSEVQERAFGD